MAKRLQDSAILGQLWYRKLSPQMKLLWKTLLDVCDIAGVWEVDLERLEFDLGWKYEPESALLAFGGRVVPLDGGRKWIIAKFVRYQYGVLKPAHRVHAAVLRCLRDHGIPTDPFCSDSKTSFPIDGEGYDTLSGVPDRVKEKEKEKDQEKEKEKEKDSEGETERGPEPVPASLFTGAPKPIPSDAAKLGPHEVAAFVRSKSVKVWPTDQAGWLRLANIYGMEELGNALEAASAADKKEMNTMEALLQRRRKASRDAQRLNQASDRAHDTDAKEKSILAARRAKDAAAKDPLERLRTHMFDQATPEVDRIRYSECESIQRALAFLASGKPSSLLLSGILGKHAELKAVAYPEPVVAP